MLHAIVRMIAPITAFTVIAEEIWQEMRSMDPALVESVHLAEWPEPDTSGLGARVLERWGRVLEARGAVSRALETADGAREAGVVFDDETTVTKVGVSKNEDPKYPRCCKYRHEIAESHEVCHRCAEVLTVRG